MSVRGGWRKKRILMGEKDQSITHTYIFTFIYTCIYVYIKTYMFVYKISYKSNPIKYFKRREDEGGVWEYMEGMNLFKVHCMNLWIYHNETL
jgi:hypothetical protein